MIQLILDCFRQSFQRVPSRNCAFFTLDVSLVLAEELLMERCVLFERCELAPANERDRFLEHKHNNLISNSRVASREEIPSVSVHQHHVELDEQV